MNLEEEKFQNLTSRIRALRDFGREYLSATSVLSILPIGISTKDFDIVVEVTKRGEDGYKLNTGKEELNLSGISSYATEGSIAKLRSVARIDNVGKSKVVVPNNFTSLINIPNWSQDSEIYRKNYTSMDIEDDDSIYTSLAQLNSMPLSKYILTKMSVRTRNTTLRFKLQVHQHLTLSRHLNSTNKRKTLSVMLKEKTQSLSTGSILSALMKA